ncbi:MAG: minor capsid protein [Rhodospirillales bacterium]|nr:minor capsid protein [Rhodospirillales bacterium]
MADGVPFQEAIDFLGQKVNLPSRAWTDLKEGAHARSFVVAGAMKDKLVSDFHGALTKALKDGTTKADFQKAFGDIAARHGWDFNGGRAWRARVIYDTNMRTARAAGRWAQIDRRAAVEKRRGRTLYLRYVAVLDSKTRPEHRAWHGTILPADHPFWRTHTPPNGWYCRCTIQVLTERDLARYGYTPTPEKDIPPIAMEDRPVNTPDGSENWPTPAGIDTGFGTNVGQSWLSGAVPPPLQTPLPPPPAALPAIKLPPMSAPAKVDPKRILPAGLKDEAYVKAFLGEFGGGLGKPAAFRDAAGHAIAVGEELFKDVRGRWKVTKLGRERDSLLLADALKTPDEIWVDWFFVPQLGRHVLRRRYLKRLALPGKAGGLAVFEWTSEGWSGVTDFTPSAASYLERQRRGALLYRKN